jgi:hypothetical protein
VPFGVLATLVRVDVRSADIGGWAIHLRLSHCLFGASVYTSLPALPSMLTVRSADPVVTGAISAWSQRRVRPAPLNGSALGSASVGLGICTMSSSQSPPAVERGRERRQEVTQPASQVQTTLNREDAEVSLFVEPCRDRPGPLSAVGD